jgi:hypothetical protein
MDSSIEQLMEDLGLSSESIHSIKKKLETYYSSPSPATLTISNRLTGDGNGQYIPQ